MRRFLCFLLAVAVLLVSVCAEELAGLPQEDSGDIAPYAVGGANLYGLTWTVLADGRVTKVGDWPMTTLETQQLAGAVYYALTNVQATSSIPEDFIDYVELYLRLIHHDVDEVEGKLQNIYLELNSYQRPLLTGINTAVSSLDERFGDRFEAWNNLDNKFYTFTNLADFLSVVMIRVTQGLYNNGGLWYLTVDGTASSVPAGRSLLGLVVQGILGLSRNLIGSDQSGTFSFLVPGEDGSLVSTVQTAGNLLDALALLGTSLQNPLAKLQYVLASDDDIALKDASKPNEDEFKDNFIGDADAAVKPSDIGELAGVSASVKDTFAGAGSPADIFSVLNDSGSYGFFSQEVADILEPPVPSALSDEPFDSEALIASDPEFWEQFDIDEEGFCTPKTSFFDAGSYLEGLK